MKYIECWAEEGNGSQRYQSLHFYEIFFTVEQESP